jgi:hypothetical protein
MAQSARVFIVPDRPWGGQSLAGPPTRCRAENEGRLDAPAFQFLRSFERVDLKCALFSSIED